MNSFLIKSYVKKLTLNDIKTFSERQGLCLSNNELELIMRYIKSDYNTIIYGNPTLIFDDLKKKLDNENYMKLEKLYFEFKDKYKDYL